MRNVLTADCRLDGHGAEPSKQVQRLLVPGYLEGPQAQHLRGPRLPSQFFNKNVDSTALDIAFWTRVSVSSEQVLRWLPLYFEAAHTFAGFFDAELFLKDFIERRARYCSSFLVNAVLFIACVCALLAVRSTSAMAHSSTAL